MLVRNLDAVSKDVEALQRVFYLHARLPSAGLTGSTRVRHMLLARDVVMKRDRKLITRLVEMRRREVFP